MPDLRSLEDPEEEESQGVTDYIKTVSFQAVHFFDKRAMGADGKPGREIIILYSLGEDGVIREFVNGKWTPFPIEASGR